MKSTVLIFTLLLLIIFFSSTRNKNQEKTLQIELNTILNARSVTTLTNGKLVKWTKGIDGNGEADGYMTMAASIFNGDKDPKALPDNPLFPSTTEHPEVLLHYSNNDSISNQTVAVTGAGSFQFEIPSNRYSKLFLALTSAEGTSTINVELKYSDGVESKTFIVPDYYADIQPNNSDFCYLAHDLAKWGTKNNMTEADHHNIDLLDIHPDQTRILTGINVEKSEAGYLVFWAATGVTQE
jgi:hypothetical protein